MLTKDQAVCLRAVDYSETSQVLTLFTRQKGKIGVIAKGSKRAKSAFGGAIEVFSFGDVVFSPSRGAKLGTLTEFEQKRLIGKLSGAQSGLNACFFAAELLEFFTQEYDPHPELFDAFVTFVKDAGGGTDDREVISLLIVFQITLLGGVGLSPVLKHCANCKSAFSRDRRHGIYFSSSATGLVCRDCEQAFVDKIKISEKAADCLCDLKLLAKCEMRVLKEIEKMIVHHFTELMHRKPKMAKYFT